MCAGFYVGHSLYFGIYTDIEVSYTPLRTGRKYDKISFSIQRKLPLDRHSAYTLADTSWIHKGENYSGERFYRFCGFITDFRFFHDRIWRNPSG